LSLAADLSDKTVASIDRKNECNAMSHTGDIPVMVWDPSIEMAADRWSAAILVSGPWCTTQHSRHRSRAAFRYGSRRIRRFGVDSVVEKRA
jgi:hypothetical protein